MLSVTFSYCYSECRNAECIRAFPTALGYKCRKIYEMGPSFSNNILLTVDWLCQKFDGPEVVNFNLKSMIKFLLNSLLKIKQVDRFRGAMTFVRSDTQRNAVQKNDKLKWLKEKEKHG